MSTHDNGGPAFPTENERQTGTSTYHFAGMTLRDYFAAKAMQARMTAYCALEVDHGWSNAEIAADAYELADAMLKARRSAEGGAS